MSDEATWRSGGEGRLDADGVRWWACDPYPTWYRWEGGELFTDIDRTAEWAEGNHPLDRSIDGD